MIVGYGCLGEQGAGREAQGNAPRFCGLLQVQEFWLTKASKVGKNWKTNKPGKFKPNLHCIWGRLSIQVKLGPETNPSPMAMLAGFA